VAADDLNSITGMEDKHRKALARRQITTLRGLADADQDVIYRAMGSIKPRPSHNQIAQWQNDARSKLVEAQNGDSARSGDEAQREDEARGQPAGARGQPVGARGQPAGARGGPGEAAADTTEWQEAASFVVAFARRRVGETWERRIEAERTEVEPAPEREVWPGWECSSLCSWMLGQADGGKPGEPEQDDGGEAQRAATQPAAPQPAAPQPAAIQPAGEPAGAAKPRGGLPQLRIDSATITDTAGSSNLVTDGAPVANPPAELVAPASVVFTVSGARRGTEVLAVARLRGQGEPGRNVADLVAVPASGRAEFDLSQVVAGQLEMTLLAWAPDCTARFVSVSLPAMRISPDPEEGPGHD
jgi:hypothetical protein